jgi:hypothetical protein
MNGMTGLKTLIALFLTTAIPLAPGMSILRAEDTTRIQVQLTRMPQTSRKNPVPEDSQMVKPTQKEREAIHQLLATKPRQKALPNADRKYLKGLLDKATWLGFERRIVHEMWTEMSGREWRD